MEFEIKIENNNNSEYEALFLGLEATYGQLLLLLLLLLVLTSSLQRNEEPKNERRHKTCLLLLFLVYVCLGGRLQGADVVDVFFKALLMVRRRCVDCG